MTTVDHTAHAMSGTRTVRGYEVPAVGTWELDAGHTQVEFIGRHLMMTKVRGRFADVQGAFVFTEAPEQSTVEVTIQMSSVESGSADRDGHLRSPDFFDVERFPTATFVADGIEWRGHEATVAGELTIVGVTRPVVLEVSYLGTRLDLDGNPRSVFSAWAEIDREDWGLTWNVALEAGGVLVSKKIRIEIETEAVLRG